jgi:transcription antitermination factor NusG
MMRLDKNLAHSFFVMADARKDVAGIKGGADGRRTWYVLHVKPRTEKKTLDFLRSYGYFHHLPVYMKITKVQRRKVRRELPLFPGYVFTKLFPDERIRMLQTNLIVHTIEVLNPREMIHQLRQISRASRAKPEMRPVHSFKAGDLVRVKYGPLRGTEGYVKREGAHATLCLNVEILGAAVEISISPEDIEKA